LRLAAGEVSLGDLAKEIRRNQQKAMQPLIFGSFYQEKEQEGK
jgi:hypothetical protein